MEFRRIGKRFSAFFKGKQSHPLSIPEAKSPKKSLLTFLGLGGVAMVNQEPPLPPVTNKELDNRISALTTKYERDNQIALAISGLLEAIKANDIRMLKYIFADLRQKQRALDKNPAGALIEIAAMQGRVKVLEEMCFHLEAPFVERNPLAKRLLQHPYRYAIDTLCSEHINGSGRFNTSNVVTDISLLMAFVQDEMIASQNQSPDRFIVLKEADMDSFNQYLEKLDRVQTKQTNDNTFSATFIIAGEHLISGELIFTKKGNATHVTMLGFDWQDDITLSKRIFKPYLEVLRQRYPQAELFVSESKIAYPSTGFSIFALLKALQSMHHHLDSLVDYAKNHVTNADALCSVFTPPILFNTAMTENDFHPTMVTRSGFMGIEEGDRVGEFYQALSQHHYVDAYTESHGIVNNPDTDNGTDPCLLVAWLANKTPNEMAQVMNRHTLGSEATSQVAPEARSLRTP